jgi:hypothetical protein
VIPFFIVAIGVLQPVIPLRLLYVEESTFQNIIECTLETVLASLFYFLEEYRIKRY